jgi:hypothetical protein
MMDTITFVLDAITDAERAFREHGLVSGEECVVCRRMISDGGVHGKDCAIDGLRHAKRNLSELRALFLPTQRAKAMTTDELLPSPYSGMNAGEGVRTPEEFAIEFGEYLAKAAVRYMGMTVEEKNDPDILADKWRALHLAIHDFRKRAKKTNAWLGAQRND